MFVWDSFMAFVGFKLQTSIERTHSSFKTQPGHLLWEVSFEFSGLKKAFSSLSFYCISGPQTATIWTHLGLSIYLFIYTLVAPTPRYSGVIALGYNLALQF